MKEKRVFVEISSASLCLVRWYGVSGLTVRIDMYGVSLIIPGVLPGGSTHNRPTFQRYEVEIRPCEVDIPDGEL